MTRLLHSFSGMLMACLFMTACTHHEVASTVEISPSFQVWKADTTQRTCKISEFVQHIDYVPLQTDKAYRIARVDKIELYDHFIVVLDKHVAKKVFVFDRQGSFLYFKGPVEKTDIAEEEPLSSAVDFYVDKALQQLYVYDNIEKNIVVYGLADGHFIRSFQIPASFSHLMVLHPNHVFFLRDGIDDYGSGLGPYRVCAFDSLGRLQGHWLRGAFNPHISMGGIFCSNVNSQGSFLFGRMFKDTIYRASEGKVQAVGKIELGNAPYPDYLSGTADQRLFAAYVERSETAYLVNKVFDTEDLFGVFIKFKHINQLFLSNKTSHKTWLLQYLINDLDNTPFPLPSYMDEQHWVSAVDAYALYQYRTVAEKRPDYITRYHVLDSLLKTVKMDANPVVMIGTTHSSPAH